MVLHSALKGKNMFLLFYFYIIKKHRFNGDCRAFIGTALKNYCINAQK